MKILGSANILTDDPLLLRPVNVVQRGPLPTMSRPPLKLMTAYSYIRTFSACKL